MFSILLPQILLVHCYVSCHVTTIHVRYMTVTHYTAYMYYILVLLPTAAGGNVHHITHVLPSI